MEVEGDSDGSMEGKKTLEEAGKRKKNEETDEKRKEEQGKGVKDLGCRRRLRF